MNSVFAIVMLEKCAAIFWTMTHTQLLYAIQRDTSVGKYIVPNLHDYAYFHTETYSLSTINTKIIDVAVNRELEIVHHKCCAE